jgi:glycosyltransferase involved in cell wall biosynthesis
MLTIAIDAHMVGQQETGNETYILGLLKGLTQIDRTNRYFIIALDPAALRLRIDFPENFAIVPLKPTSDLVRVPLAMPWTAHKLGADVLHVTYVAPPISPCPTVVTVHDITFKMFPEFFSPRDRFVLSILVPPSMRRASYIIAVSEQTKVDIVTHYSIPATRISVTLEAPDERFAPVSDPALLHAIREKYALAETFVLAVGNLQPRKNLETLIHATARLKSRGTRYGQLVIVGQTHWQARRILASMHQAGPEIDVRFLGYVPDEDLPALYSASQVFAFPSLYEGFGLPPLEAMACGTPVICSNAGALEEIVGGAGLLLPPKDVNAWTDALQSILENPELRTHMIHQGLAHVRAFSWKDTATKTLEIYERTASFTE